MFVRLSLKSRLRTAAMNMRSVKVAWKGILKPKLNGKKSADIRCLHDGCNEQFSVNDILDLGFEYLADEYGINMLLE